MSGVEVVVEGDDPLVLNPGDVIEARWEDGRIVVSKAPAPDVGPGSFSCHEALHMASFLFEAVSEKLCSHPTVQSDRQWARLAEEAETALWKLYQAIGGEHLP